MKKTTIDRIVNNYSMGKSTYIGRYVYTLQYHPMAGKMFIVRCRRGDEKKEWLTPDGIVVNGWEWLMDIKF